MATRRSFLSLLGGAAVAGPSALSATAERMAMVPIAAPGASIGDFPPAEMQQVRRCLSVEAAKLLGTPDWLKDQWKDEGKHVQFFDPDIAALKSMSLSAKIVVQRKRNYEWREAEFWRRFEVQELRDSFISKHGFFNWW